VSEWSGHAQIIQATQTLKEGGVIAYPTEAVWGLGCDPWSEAAVEKILRLKNRHVDKGLILIAGETSQVESMLQGLNQHQRDRFSEQRVKPTTWLVPHNGFAPDWIVGRHTTIALRVTKHPLAAALCNLFGGPIVSTSANPQSLPAAATGLKVQDYFSKDIDFQTAGEIGLAAKESEIRDLLTGGVIRPG
jgi:L-threonylcarbamoyladenylate synthase